MWVRGHPRIDSLLLLQVVEGDQNRTRAHQRLKTGDLRRPPYLLFGSCMVVVLAYSQFPYRTKEQNTIPEEEPLCGRGNRIDRCDGTEGHSVFNVFGPKSNPTC